MILPEHSCLWRDPHDGALIADFGPNLDTTSSDSDGHSVCKSNLNRVNMTCCDAIRYLAKQSVALFADMERERLYLPERYPGWWSIVDEIRELSMVKGVGNELLN